MSSTLHRSARAALVVAACALALTSACSSVDDFTKFSFTDGGAGDGMIHADLAGSMIGDPCSAGSCTGGLSCFTTVGNASFPGGTCTASCSTQTPSCPTGSGCGQVEGTSLCLQACNPTGGAACRTGWSCCDGQRMVLGPGVCAPSNSNFCGH